MSDALPAESTDLRIGLQEWAVCTRALGDGRLMFLVRKGGIHERHGGFFAPEHERFACLPTTLHQDETRLHPAYRGAYFRAAVAGVTTAAPGVIPVTVWATVARVWKCIDLARVIALGEELAWTSDELATRFRYREQPWLYVLALRAQRLPAMQALPDRAAYAGCRSWIPLTDAVATVGSSPVLNDAVFNARLAHIGGILDL